MAEETMVNSFADTGIDSTTVDEPESSSPFNLDAKNIILLSVATITVFFLVYQFFFSPKYQLLYSELNQSDAAAIGSYLEKKNMKFKISPDGNSIMVAKTSIPKLRLELANKGMPKGQGVGFEIFDKTNINISDFNQRVNYNRALEGELARTIASLDSVKNAKVHLALAKKSVFKNQKNDAKASVVITTEFKATLTDQQVKGIQHLVAASIPNLEATNVQITDQEGNSLVKFGDSTSMANEKTANNDKKLRDFEHKLEANLIDMLTPILGAGNVLVNVAAEMDFDESEVNIELFSPKNEDGTENKPVIRSEKVTNEKYRNENPRRFGTVGTQNNMPSFVQQGDKGIKMQEGKDYFKEDNTKNYEISKSVERIRKASGLPRKVSVAVVVNKDLSPAERTTLRETVKVAAGIDLKRGDQVIVTGIKFSSTPYEDISDQESKKQFEEVDRQARLKKYLSLILVVAVSVVIVMVVMFSLTTNLDSKRAAEIESLLQEEDIPLLHTLDEKIQEAEEAYSRQLSLEGNRTVTSMKNGLSQMALQDPRTIAKGLQTYITD